MNGNYIKICRSLLNWEWYGNVNVKSVFIHCLLKANWKDGNFEGKTIERGSFVTSIPKMASEIGLTERQIRTALDHLKVTGELTVKTTNKYSVITINNYSQYQDVDRQTVSQMTDKSQTSDRQTVSQMTAIEEYKESKELEERKEGKDLSVSKDTLRPTDVRRVVEAWNDLGIRPIKKIAPGTNRYEQLRKRINDFGIDDVLEAIDRVRWSDFLQGGGSKGWIIDFDWFIRPNNFQKVLEGNYDNRVIVERNSNVYDEWEEA